MPKLVPKFTSFPFVIRKNRSSSREKALGKDGYQEREGKATTKTRSSVQKKRHLTEFEKRERSHTKKEAIKNTSITRWCFGLAVLSREQDRRDQDSVSFLAREADALTGRERKVAEGDVGGQLYICINGKLHIVQKEAPSGCCFCLITAVLSQRSADQLTCQTSRRRARAQALRLRTDITET